MNKQKAKKLAMAAVSIALVIMMCFSFVACKGNNDDDSGNYYQESTAKSKAAGTGFTEEKGKFYADYDNLDDAHKAGKRLNERIAEEGIVLLKNANNTLPLNRDERDVTLMGIKSVDIQTGGGGSGSGSPGGYGIPVTTLEQSMEDAGFSVNKKVLELYRQYFNDMTRDEGQWGMSLKITNELPIDYYNDMVTKSYRSYDDAAIITFSRAGSENKDHLMSNVPGREDTSEHILQLSDAEEDLIRHAKKNFKKVVVLINSANILEVGELNDEKTADNLGVDAILHIAHVGNDGAAAIGRILNGEVNPSGHTVDTWARDFKKGPYWNNFGTTGNVNDPENLKMYLQGSDENLNFYSVEYREDIYMGYRFYETVADDLNDGEPGAGDKWYAENVVYPFGYGLSYTSFEWELDASIAPEAKIEKANSTITMKVKVTNTGDVAGKDVVQLYATAPYTKGGIEKASTVLVGFAKTKLLKPGQSETVTIQIAAQDLASFDWNDKNNNGFVGYELEAGSYTINACRDAHTPVVSVKRTVKNTIKCETDLDTGKKITAAFSQTEGPLAIYNSTNEALLNNLLSREGGLNGTIPVASTKAERTVSQAFLDEIYGLANCYAYDDDKDDLWYVSQVPAGWTQAASHKTDYSDVTTKIIDMAGIPYTDPTVVNGVATAATDEGSKKWDAFMNQLTWEELCQLVSQGSYARPAVDSIGKPLEIDCDGPMHIAWIGDVQVNNNYGYSDTAERTYGMGTCWVTPVLVASSWNTELAEEQGLQIGNESILCNSPGWYGPSLNIHRSPFGGRNFEYYSEDGVLSGKMAAAVTLGATSKGTVCYAKHIFLNDQETKRDAERGLFTYATEQAIREIYLKAFEEVIKTGRSLGTMAASNRIGKYVAYGNHALHNVILRDEWNFKGLNETDSMGGRAHRYASMNHLIRNGVDMPLGIGRPIPQNTSYATDDCEYYLEEGMWNAEENMVYVPANAAEDASRTFSLASPTQYYNVRKAAQHVLYASANSNGINNGINNSTANNIDKTYSFTALQNVNEKIVTENDDFKVIGYTCSIKSGALPKGLTLNSAGVLTGQPTESGTFKVTVTLLGDGWVKKDMQLNITVGDYFICTGETNVSVGESVNLTLSCENIKIGDNLMTGYGPAPVSMISYSVDGLPDGLEVKTDSTTGVYTIEGTVAKAGTYNVKVTMTAMGFASVWGFQIPATQTFTQTITIIVT